MVETYDTMYATLEEVGNAPFLNIPREPVVKGERWIKHISCDGARFHVLSWSTNGTYCSEPDCIVNKPKEKTAK